MNRFILILLVHLSFIHAQDELLELIIEEKDISIPVQATFKATRIVNAQSIELPRPKTLEFMILHRFGSMKDRFYNLFGMDEAVIRFDLTVAFDISTCSYSQRTSNLLTDANRNNSLAGDEYLGSDILVKRALSPLVALKLSDKYDIVAKVLGGGLVGQSDAILLGVARALLLVNSEYRGPLKDLGLLTRDSRVKERKKYGRKRARKGYQFRKR